MDILIAGGSPDPMNHNALLRSLVAEGFAEILGRDRVFDVPFEQAASTADQHRPALVVVFGSCLPPGCDYRPLRQACDRAGSHLAFWLHDDPYEFDASARIRRLADTLFTNDRWAAAHYHRDNVWHLPLAASAAAHTPAEGPLCTSIERDVFFCGVGFQNRLGIIDDLAPVLGRLKTMICGDGWDTKKHRFCRNDRIDGKNIRNFYASSLAVLNMGREFNYANRSYDLVASTPGPRTFEAAMAGSCQLMITNSLEIMDSFEVGKEILLFDTPDEFADLMAMLRKNPTKRDEIALAARDRCLRDHTYANRAKTILAKTGMSRLMQPMPMTRAA